MGPTILFDLHELASPTGSYNPELVLGKSEPAHCEVCWRVGDEKVTAQRKQFRGQPLYVSVGLLFFFFFF